MAFKRRYEIFRETTANKTIIMGRKTFESLPGLLKGRKHIILSSNKSYKVDGATVMHTKEEILDYIKKQMRNVLLLVVLKYIKNFYLIVNIFT